MKQILFIALLVMCCLASCASQAAAQIQLEVPDIEYPNDLSELRTLRRVFVHSAPDPLARQLILKELSRKPGLFDIVEQPESADFYLVFYGSGDVGANSFAAPPGAGQVTNTGTLVAFRQVETCNGVRPRLLFITRKSKTVHSGIVLPLTSLGQGGFSPLGQSGLSPRPFSKQGLRAELALRLGLFLIGKKFPRALKFDQLNNNLAFNFNNKLEVEATKEFVQLVKKARKETPPSTELPRLAPDWFNLSATVKSPQMRPPAAVSGQPIPCPPNSSRRAGTNYGVGDSFEGSPVDHALPSKRPAAKPRRAGRTRPSAPPR